MKKYIFIFSALLIVLIMISRSANAMQIKDNDEKNLYKENIESVSVFNHAGEKVYITEDDIYLMAQVVHAESCAEPYEGKVAVASVILNRVRDKQFPKSVEGVIKQKYAFSCVRDGKIEVIPSAASYTAVLEALKGKDPTERAVFFYNPKIATSTWMKNIKKSNIRTIGNHVFFIVK